MDWSNPIGSAVSGAFGLIGSGINYAIQKKLAAQQNEYNLQMWNLQNEYNSPQNQMKRFEEAGLNPNLIYGQGNAGNSSSAPQMVTPSAPNFSKDMQELAQAFNIEGLRTAIANRKKAQADARIAAAGADNAEGENEFYKNLGWQYTIDPTSGRLIPKTPDHEFKVFNRESGYIAEGRILREMLENFRTNSLLLPRANLIASQQALNSARQGMIAPQTSMLEYQAKYYPWSFWIGNVRQGAQAIGNIVDIPLKFKRPPIRYSHSN